MKKFLAILASLMMVFMFVSCGSAEEEAPLEPVAVGEAGIYEDVSFTVTNVETSDGDEWETPADGKEYVIVTVEITNNSDETYDYDEFSWKMQNDQGQIDDITYVSFNSDNELGSGSLTKGGKKTGTLVFEEPKDASSLILKYLDNMFDDEEVLQFVIR